MARVAWDNVQIDQRDDLFEIGEGESVGAVRRQFGVMRAESANDTIDVVAASVDVLRSSYSNEYTYRRALAEQMRTRFTKIEGNEQELLAQSGELVEISANITDLQNGLSSRATIDQLADAQADNESARAQLGDSLNATFSTGLGNLSDVVDTKASLSQLASVESDAESARAQLSTTLRSEFDGNLAALEQNLSTEIDNTTGRMEAMYAVRLQTDSGGNRYIGGFGLANDGQTVQAAFDVDLFSVGRLGTGKVQPFIVDTGTGNVYLRSAVIQDASITSAKIIDLTADKIVSGTFATGAAPDPRLEMSLDGGYFWWAGQGAKTAANASAYVDENGNFVGNNITARGDIEATSIKAGSANIIDTINLRGRAITNLVYYYASAQANIPENTWRTFASVNVDIPSQIGGEGYLEIRWALNALAEGGADDDAGIEVRVLLDGSVPTNGNVWEKWSYTGSGGGSTDKEQNNEQNVSYALATSSFANEHVEYFPIPSSLGVASMQVRMNGNDARYYTFRKLIAKVFLR